MAKIIDGDSLVVSSSVGNLGVDGNIWLDTTAKTISFAVYGDLTSAKEGVTLQALYSKFIKLWETATYNKFPFPMYVIDAKSGQFNFGFDGGSYNGWVMLNDTSRQMLRDGGWNEYLANGTLDRVYVGIVSLGDVNTGAQLYYQRDAADAPTDFTFDDEVNEGILVFDDGTVDKRTFFKAFVREEQKKYKDSTLADTGQTATGAYTVNVLLSNEDDLDVLVADAGIATTPYTGINISYYTTNQLKDLNTAGDDFPFRIIVEGNGATLQEVYTKVQYLLRQNSNINTSGDAGTVTGKTANDLMYFVGPDLYCRQSVFIENLDPAYINNVYFIDQNGISRTYNYAAAGKLQFNSYLTQGSTGYYRMYITDSVTGTDDYGTATAITLNDKDGNPINGTITGSEINFTFAYDTNTQGGRSVFTSPGGDVGVTVVAGNKGIAKPVVQTGTITRSKSNPISLSAEQDRAYVA